MKKILYSSILLLCTICYMLSYTQAVSLTLRENLLRFHIISNSSSEADTKIKIQLRDYIQKEFRHSSALPASKEYLACLEETANGWLEKKGISYKANAVYERCYIPKKSYMNITLPQGWYNAIRLTLGTGSGENWWCVAYPSLCFTEEPEGEMSADGAEALKHALPDDCFELITDSKSYRFFIVDFISGLVAHTITQE